MALGLCAGAVVAPPGALAFPTDDQTPGSVAPAVRGTLSAPDAKDLRQQSQTLGGGAVAPGSGGWIILPRLDVTGLLTDNALQVSSPRQSDVAILLAPGIGITADTSRLQLRFDYAPILSVYARTSSQNSLSHYLNTTGLLTLVPEQVFIDMRASAGVQPLLGGFGGAGGFGLGVPQAGGLGTSLAGAAFLAKDNQVQSFTAGLSPYWVRDFGDYGTMRIGGSFQYSRSSNVSGFGTVPFADTGTNAQSLFSTQQTARYVTGEFLGRFQNTSDLLLSQTPMSDATGTAGRRFGSSYSSQQTFTNRTAYALSPSWSVFVTLGYQNLVYSGGLSQKVKGIVWNVGTTYTPNPDSTITVSYGRQSGSNSLSLNSRYLVTARTVLTATYTSQLTTQLQNLQNQLDQGVINAAGVLVNSQTGAPLLIGNNGLALQPGLFRYDTFTAGAQTGFARDQLALTVIMSKQSAPNGSNTVSPTTVARTLTASWTHELRPDLSLNALLGYTTQQVPGSSGSSTTLSGSVGLTYLMTDTLTGRLRYSHFSRQSASGVLLTSAAFNRLNFTQNMVTVTMSKQF